MLFRQQILPVTLLILASLAAAQKGPPAIEVPYKGLRYSMLSRGGVTVMMAPLDRNILEYSTAQVWISNGSNRPVRVSPQFFRMVFDGSSEPLKGTPDNTVLNDVMKRAKPHDIVELVKAYETTLFGFANEKSMGYYQKRKQQALASFGGGGKLRAAATASAIILPENLLRPGEIVDGTVFFRTEGRRQRVTTLGAELAGSLFDFPQAINQ